MKQRAFPLGTDHCRLILISFLFLIESHLFTDAAYDSSYAFMDIHRDGLNQPETFCVNYQEFQTRELPHSPKEAKPMYIGWWDHKLNQTDICQPNTVQFGGNQLVPALYQTQWTELMSCSREPHFNRTKFDLVKFQVGIAEKHGKVKNLLFLVDKGKPNYYGHHDYLFSQFQNPEINATDPINVYYLYREDFFQQILPLLDIDKPIGPDGPTQLRVYRPQQTFPFDIAVFIISFIAISAVAIGSLWAAVEARHELASPSDFEDSRPLEPNELTAVISAIPPSTTISSDDEASIPVPEPSIAKQLSPVDQLAQMSACGHCCYVMFTVGFVVLILMLAFYFRSQALFFFTIFLVIVGTISMHRCLYTLFHWLAGGWDLELFSLAQILPCVVSFQAKPQTSCWNRPFHLISSLVFALSGTFCLLWFLNRTLPNEYLVLDVINFCICVFAIKDANIRSLRLFTFLLLAMFVYDLFMVFGTPFLFGGCSVMLEVVTGIDCNSARARTGNYSAYYPVAPIEANLPEKMPLIFSVPYLSDPMLKCFDLTVEFGYPKMMLGLGDVIVPGYFVAFCFWLDVAHGNRWHNYGIIAMLGYTLGMASTFTALHLMDRGQPALIYLVPCTLIPIILYTWHDGVLRAIWNGDNIRLNVDKDESERLDRTSNGICSGSALNNGDVEGGRVATDYNDGST